MLWITTLGAKAGMRDQNEAETLITYLIDKGYLPVIRSMFAGMLKLAKLPAPDETLITKVFTPPPPLYMEEPIKILGELFFTDDLAYALVPVGEDILQASAVGYKNGEEVLKSFCADIEEVIKTRFDGRRVRGMEFDWKPQRLRPSIHVRRRYSYDQLSFGEERARGALNFESIEPNYSSKDVEAANFLVDFETRQFTLKLAQLGKMRDKDAREIAKPRILQKLLSLGLVAEEYLLTCKQDQHTICVVPSKENLSKEPMASFRCSVCERSLPEENLQTIYTFTEKGKKLTDSSLWMSIWVTELLKENGVRKEAIRWRLEADGEELDIMVEDFDSRIFFELKDREFGLGDAYPFVYRITRYGGRVGIVVTMDKVSPDAQKFFKEESERRAYPVQMRYFEGSENIQKGVAKLVNYLCLSQAHRLIQPLSRRAGFDLWPILEHWINTKMKEMPQKEVTTTRDNSG